jgi:WD40 repeat protein
VFVACSLEKNAKIMKGRPIKILHTLAGHSDTINSCKFARNANNIITGGSDRQIRMYDANRGISVLNVSSFIFSFEV